MDNRHCTGKNGKDLIVDEHTGQHRYGVFIEVGAWNGYELSSTYYLEKTRDWRGILVEPIKEKAQEASINRWNPVINACIGTENKEVDFLHIKGYSEMISGINDKFAPNYRKRIDNEINQHKQTTEIVKTICYRLDGLMEKVKITKADYLSLDTQTSELEVLQAFDPSKYPIKIIGLDTNGNNTQEIIDWFETKGYSILWKGDRADDYLFINKTLKWTWE